MVQIRASTLRLMVARAPGSKLVALQIGQMRQETAMLAGQPMILLSLNSRVVRSLSMGTWMFPACNLMKMEGKIVQEIPIIL